MSDADMIAHYRVAMGKWWWHAVALGTAEDVRKRLADIDQVWTRPTLELVASKPLDAWNGPFPRGGGVKFWAVEED